MAVVAAFLAGSMTLGAGAASANVLTVTGGLGTVTCTTSCEGFTGAGSPGEPTGLGTLSDTAADPYEGQPASESDEVSRLNILAGTSFTSADATRTDGSGGDDMISTLAEYIVLKIGNQALFIKNTSGGLLEIAWDAFAGAGAGLSHYTEFGEIPIPGAVWLMGAGLAGIGFASRKKKAL